MRDFSRDLPKRDCKDGLDGEKEGILLVHQDIIVAVACVIRKAGIVGPVWFLTSSYSC